MIGSQFKSFDLVQGVLPCRFPQTARGQNQAWPVIGAPQLSRHEQDLMAQRLERGILELGRQTEPLEPVDEVVGQQEQMEVRLVREKVPSRDGAKRIVPFELLDEQLDARPIVVEAPEVQRLRWQIRDQNLVVILAQFEERQLLAWFFGLGSADDDEAVKMGPPNGLVAELGHLDAAAGTHVPQMRQLAFDRACQAGDDHEPGPLCFEPLDQRAVVKPFVRADNRQPDPWGPLRETCRQQVERPTGGMGIARPQLAVPEVLAPTLETEQRVIRRPPALDRVVADPCSLLLPVDDQNRRVDVEDEPPRRVWSRRQAEEETIVKAPQFGERGGGNPQQESTQCGRVGIAAQPGQILKDTVLPEQARAFDPLEAKDDRVQEREQHLANTVAIVALDQTRLVGEQLLEVQATKETMQQVDSAVVSQ